MREVLHSGRIADLTTGQCASRADYAAYQLRPTDCGDIDAVFEYAGKATLNICPDGKRTEDGSYFIFIGADKTEKLCLAMNLKEGECYLIDISAKTVKHVACAEGGCPGLRGI